MCYFNGINSPKVTLFPAEHILSSFHRVRMSKNPSMFLPTFTCPFKHTKQSYGKMSMSDRVKESISWWKYAHSWFWLKVGFKGIMFFTPKLRFVCLCMWVCVCVCVCLSVCAHVCDEMAGLSNMVSTEVNTNEVLGQYPLQQLKNAALVKIILIRTWIIWTIPTETREHHIKCGVWYLLYS